MKVHRLTMLLLLIVCATIGLTLGRQIRSQRDNPKENDYAKQLKARHLRFPTANYNEPELTDRKKNEARKQKNLRKNNYSFVASDGPDWATELVRTNEGGIDLPALPLAESSYIILGKVISAEAHLSENKKNVYSEFTVSVKKIFKTATALSEEEEIVIDRTGGFVKYPNGHTILYRVSDLNMPLSGERYLFFLTSKDQDLTILTAYELNIKGIAPLDQAPQFEKFRGITESILLEKLQNELQKASP